MNAKDMAAQAAEDNPRMGAIKRRMQQKKPASQPDPNNEVVNERKTAGY